MLRKFIPIFPVLLSIFSFSICVLSISDEINMLNVGEELLKETLPLQMGSRSYRLQGLNANTWYEVKISYPASIPASFLIQLKRENSDLGLNQGRKLLNTEKLIFKTGNLGARDPQCVSVTVEPEGVVAIPQAKEREIIIFNIVCDELLLGIPHKAWWVAVLVLICLCLAFTIPSFLPSHLLLIENQKPANHQHGSKNS